MRRLVWLTLLLLCVAVTPWVPDVTPSTDAWEQLDETGFEALPVTMSPRQAPVDAVSLAPARSNARPVRLVEAEIFRPPIG